MVRGISLGSLLLRPHYTFCSYSFILTWFYRSSHEPRQL